MSNQQIEQQVVSIITKEHQLEQEMEQAQKALEADPKFKLFLQKQSQLKDAQTQSAAVWKEIEAKMIESDIKSIKGEWGYITIAERQNWNIDEALLPKKFFKKVVDTKRITDTFRLEGKPIAGAEPYTTKYLTKKIKETPDNE